MKKCHDVAKVRFEKHYFLLRVDGRDYKIDLRQHSKKLAFAGCMTQRKVPDTLFGSRDNQNLC